MRRLNFEDYKKALKQRYKEIYDDAVHDPIVEDLVETYNMIARFTEAINEDRESQTMIYLLRDSRLHYRQLLTQLLISFQSIKSSEVENRNSISNANTIITLSNQISKLADLLQTLIQKLPDAERKKYEKYVSSVLNNDFEELVITDVNPGDSDQDAI